MAGNSADGIGEVERATLRQDAKTLSPELCKLILPHLDHRSMGVVRPADMRKVFDKLHRLSAHQCPSEVRKDIGKAILENKNPVDVFFDCIPDPKEFERILYDIEDSFTSLNLACSHALHSLKALTTAHGRAEMATRFRDPVLDKLFLFADRLAREKFTENDECVSKILHEELLSIGSAVRRVICPGCSTELTIHQTLGITEAFMYATEDDMKKLGIECQNKACPIYIAGIEKVPGTVVLQRYPAYNERTRQVLGYLGWLSHGRRDSECTVEKFWETRNSAELRSMPPFDLRSLPLGLVDVNREQTCQDTKDLRRRAFLFSLVLNQYILSTTGAPRSIHTVKVEDGIIKAMLGGDESLYIQSVYAGIAPRLNLSLPEVQGALRAFGCFEMAGSAKTILEYFFLDSGAKIEFIHFVPKNVHTPVVQVKGDWTSSNMVPLHTVAVLTTKSGLNFVLDPTAAQYGWTETFVPLDVYTRCRVDHIIITDDPAPLNPNRPPTAKTPPPVNIDLRARWRRTCVAEYAIDKVKGHILAEMPNGNLSDVIGLPQDDFDRYCRDLDRHLTTCMGSFSKKRAS